MISLGIPVVMSATGGNCFFEKFNLNGLKLYTTLNEACQELNTLQRNDKKELEIYGEELVNLFNKYFTVEKFASKYVEILRDIVGK